ncbi:MAG: ABC transporter permease [Frisingicoccus sp.]|uniref:ABC transporter permease n=1 Tax=Frisingicoccus sp. TaxID=1918627 RepID=UPI00261C11E5|nr:ABC transporter permease [Frisingicoccus sp.]MDD6233092.1 ABC transporter permease [Frisingicoccus sp.]
MKRFLKLYMIEQKLALRSGDMLLFGVAMPVGIMILIYMIAGQKQAGEGFTYLESSFASLVAVGICAAAFMGIPLTIADYRDKKILKHFFTTPCSPMWILGSDVLCGAVTAMLSATSVSLVSVIFLGYKVRGNILGFVGAWFLTLVSMFSIGLLMASLCRTVKSVNAVTTLVYFPMLFLSGATIPYELFPSGLQKVSNVLPLTQGIKLMKAVSMGMKMDSIWKTVVLLVGITLVCTMISVKTFRWE